MTEERALKHARLVLWTTEGERARIALATGGTEKISDLKEVTFEDLETSVHAIGEAVPAANRHLNMLQRRKMVLMPLWHQDQDVHELQTWFGLTTAMFDAWREERAETFGSTQASQGNKTQSSSVADAPTDESSLRKSGE
jgi:hypothetical protein